MSAKIHFQKAFTLIELLVSMAILSLLLLLLTQMLGQVQRAWTSSKDRIGQFREARVAFDIIARNLSQASLNTYWDYHYDKETNSPDYYERRSELHFLTFDSNRLSGLMPGATPVGHALFFQAPLGFSLKYPSLNNLFNGRGYFVAHGDDLQFRPKFTRGRSNPVYRYRLMEFRPPAEQNQVFADGMTERLNGSDETNFDKWWRHAETEVLNSDPFYVHVHPLAENIIMLIVSPRDTLEDSGGDRRNTFSKIAPTYAFDSNDHVEKQYAQQIPPLVKITMVAIDEVSAIRKASQSSRPPLNIPNSLFKRTDRYNEDVEELSELLTKDGVNFRVFSTMVMLRSSRWSTLVSGLEGN